MPRLQINFKAQVDEIVRQNKTKIDALIRQSVNDLVEDAQVSTAKGGRMRVDTGFLRNSGQMSLTGMPSGPTRGDEGKSYSEPVYQATLARVKAGDTIYFGWTAAYAGPREFHDAFLEGALQKWQQIVTVNCGKLIT